MKLADLGQRHAGEQGGPKRQPGKERRKARGGRFYEQNRERRQRQENGMLQKKPDVEQHADRDEKEAGEDVAKGQDIAQRLMAVLRFRDDQPGEKRAQGEREPRRVGQPGYRHEHRDGRDQKELAAAGLGDAEKYPGRDPFGHDRNEQHDPDGLCQKEQRSAAARNGACQKRNQQHHRNRRHILEDQDAQRRVAVRGFHLGSILEGFQDNRRAAQGKEKTGKNGLFGSEAEEPGRPEAAKDRQGKLQRPPEHNGFSDPQEAPQRKLHADREHQEHDADFGQRFYRINLPHQPKAVRPGNHPGQQKADDERQMQPMAQIKHDDGQEDDDQDFIQDKCVHFSLILSSVPMNQ